MLDINNNLPVTYYTTLSRGTNVIWGTNDIAYASLCWVVLCLA